MKNKVKILLITNELLTTCGVSKHLLYFLSAMENHVDFEFTILCGGGDSIDIYKKSCKDVLVSPVIKHENRSILNFLKAAKILYKILSKNNFQIIHSQNHYASNIAKFVSRFIKKKTLQTVHGIIEPVGKLNHYPSEYFIAVNEHIYNYLTKQKRNAIKNVKLIRSGIPIKTDIQKSHNTKIKIISGGRLVPEKGFDIFIEAISKLKKYISDKAEFIIAGKGDYEHELKNYASSLNVNINFIGELEDLTSELMSTNILVTASQFEGFPMTIIEAAINKNLIISSNFLGYDSILKDKNNCLVFNLNDSVDLANKLEYAIENFEDMNEIIENGYQVAIKEFNVDKMVNKTILFYKEILQ